jgi:hypothetical protein
VRRLGRGVNRYGSWGLAAYDQCHEHHGQATAGAHDAQQGHCAGCAIDHAARCRLWSFRPTRPANSDRRNHPRRPGEGVPVAATAGLDGTAGGPTSQQQAQDTIIGYLKKTLQALPPGIALDANRYSGGTNTPPCQDVETGVSPNSFTTIGDLQLPAGTTPDVVISTAGEAWKSWGWYVIERDGFYKPNRFGYGPDGYRLQMHAAAQPGYSPSLQADSPCFPADLPNDRRPFPMILTAG